MLRVCFHRYVLLSFCRFPSVVEICMYILFFSDQSDPFRIILHIKCTLMCYLESGERGKESNSFHQVGIELTTVGRYTVEQR